MRASETVSGSFGKMIGLAGGLAASLGVAGLGKSVLDMGVAFDDLGNTWAAVTHGSMTAMQQKAIELGNDLSLPATSASDAENAMVELAKGGLQAAEAMDAAKGTLQLAAAAGVDAGQAAIFEADALNTFSLKGKDATMVADLLAGAANASSGEITDMALSLQQAGAVFAAAHIPIQTTVTLISEMAQNGIRGSDAGTSLKTMMLALQTPTSQAAGLMKQLNFELYDNKGRMRDFRDVIKDVQGPLSKLTQEQRDHALGVIFGSDAVRAANIIFGQGVQAYDSMREAVTKQGVAADVAGAKSQGLGGALRGIQSELETTGLRIYKFAEPALTALATDFSKVLPGAIDTAGNAIGSWVTSVGKELDTLARESGLKSLASDLQMIWGETHPSTGGGLHAADAQDRTVAVPQTDNAAAGKLIGDRLVDAIRETAPRLSKAIGDLIVAAFQQVDWYALGTEAAPAFEGFVIAFATAALNPNLWTEAIKKHPVEGLIGVATLATIIFGPEEAIGVRLAEFLGRIPLVGSILAWVVRSLNKVGGPGRNIGKFFGDIFAGVGKGIEEALGREEGAILGGVKGIVSKVLEVLDGLKTGFFVKAEEAMQALGRGIGTVLKDVRTEALKVVNAVDEILTFLISRAGEIGYNAMSTLKTGMAMAWDTVKGWVVSIVSRIWDAIGPTLSSLWDRGYGIIQGLLDGMKSAWSKVTDFVGGIAGWIADHKGPLDYDRQLLIPHGRALMAGLHEGLASGFGPVRVGVTAMAPRLAAAVGGTGGRGPTTYNITNHIQGSGLNEGQLMSVFDKRLADHLLAT